VIREIELDEKRELTLVLADDQVATRAGVRGALEPHGMRVVAEAATADEAIAAALSHRPDVCVLEVGLPGSGIRAVRQISAALPATRIVMLSASERDEDLFGSLRAGADGYLVKTVSVDWLPQAIRGVVRGEAALSREMAARLIREFREGGHRRRLAVPGLGRSVELTSREFDVLQRLRRRMCTGEIAAELGISEITVRRHISAVLHKLQIPSRRGAIELLERAEEHALADDHGLGEALAT
jgi:two-component system, NarL family, nitrate/nitrite response regulator NarL